MFFEQLFADCKDKFLPLACGKATDRLSQIIQNYIKD